MHELNFSRLQRKLLLGGVAPKYATRTIRELNSHLESLTREFKKNGQSELIALDSAYKRIGDEDTIVKEALGKPELKSWSYKYTKTIYIFTPIILYTIFVIITGTLMGSYSIEVNANGDWPLWYVWLSKSWMVFIEYFFSPLIVIVFCVLATHRNVKPFWPIVGIIAVSFLGSGWDMYLTVPTEAVEGYWLAHWGYGFMPWRIVQSRWDTTIVQVIQCGATIVLALSVFRYYRPHKLVTE